MTSVNQNVMLLVAAAVTILALAGQKLLPPKRLTIYPSGTPTLSLYADESWGGNSVAHWQDRSDAHWHCKLAQSNVYPVCGMAFSFAEPIDFSVYEILNIRMRYTGEAVKLRVYIRNHDPAYSETTDTDSHKFNSVTLRTSDLTADWTVVHLSEFAVAEWWLDENNIPRELALPEMAQVTTLGFDLPYPQVFGLHDIQVDQIELVGPMIAERKLYLGLLVAWLVVLSAAAGYSLLTRSTRQ